MFGLCSMKSFECLRNANLLFCLVGVPARYRFYVHEQVVSIRQAAKRATATKKTTQVMMMEVVIYSADYSHALTCEKTKDVRRDSQLGLGIGETAVTHVVVLSPLRTQKRAKYSRDATKQERERTRKKRQNRMKTSYTNHRVAETSEWLLFLLVLFKLEKQLT